jgi:hypothetical protein
MACAGPRDPQARDLKSLSLSQLGDVEVTTQFKEPTEVWNTPAAICVLTNDDIRRSGVTSVADALRLIPGVNVARINGSRNWAVGIRGFGDQYSKYVLVLIDGRSVYTPLFGGVLWTVNNVLLKDIDHIEVIRGPGGTIWGADAVNGIINIITKSAKDTQVFFSRREEETLTRTPKTFAMEGLWVIGTFESTHLDSCVRPSFISMINRTTTGRASVRPVSARTGHSTATKSRFRGMPTGVSSAMRSSFPPTSRRQPISPMHRQMFRAAT